MNQRALNDMLRKNLSNILLLLLTLLLIVLVIWVFNNRIENIEMRMKPK